MNVKEDHGRWVAGQYGRRRLLLMADASWRVERARQRTRLEHQQASLALSHADQIVFQILFRFVAIDNQLCM